MKSALCTSILLLIAASVRASYEDSRCKCVCVDHSVPKDTNDTSLEPTRTVYVKAIPPDKCTCPLMLEDKSDLCPYCDCKYQVRNTATIKAVVVIIIVIICTLSLYLAFMLVLDPFLASRGRKNLTTTPTSTTSFSPFKSIRTFRSHISSRSGQDNGSRRGDGGLTGFRDTDVTASGAPVPLAGSGSTAVNRAREQQSRWKGRIEEQRDRVFNERTILN